MYLLYTLLEALHNIRLEGDFYTLLGITPTTPDREIKARFRRLAAKFHPDKLSQLSNGDSSLSDTIFVQLKLAQDTLLDPAKRFAYDRFGPSIVSKQHPGLKNIKDFVYAGLSSLIPEYATSALALVVLNFFWFPKWGQYWRYLVILTSVFVELYLLTHSWEPSPISTYIANAANNVLPGLLPPHLLPFQLLSTARRMAISINIFISQLVPPDTGSNAEQDRQIQAQIAHLNQVAQRTDAEANGLLSLGLAPFRGDTEKVKRLRRGMKEGIVMGAIGGSQEVQEAVKRAAGRRKAQERH